MKRRVALGELTWPELSGRAVTLLVPLGATEQHGPHLPLDTDTRIATRVAQRAAEVLAASAGAEPVDSLTPAVLCAPGLCYGASGEHEGFPGTVSVGRDALRLLLLEYGRSACRWADRLVFVNGHGGNGATLSSAVRTLRYEGRDVAWFPCATPSGDAHAGITETSVLLHFSPQDVHLSKAEVGNTAPVGTLMETMRAGGVSAASPNGVLGDPAGADAEYGARLAEKLVDDLVAAVPTWTVSEAGQLG